MSFVSKAVRITAAVATVGTSELTGVPAAMATAKKRSNNRHQSNVVADGILQAQGVKAKRGRPAKSFAESFADGQERAERVQAALRRRR